MDFENFVFKKFVNCFYAKDPKGRKKEFKNRKFACFIITLSGKISFTANGKCICADKDCAVFLPQGLTYTNECICDAQSIVFNFITEESYCSHVALAAIPEKVAKDCYDTIKKLSASIAPQKNMSIMKNMYALAEELFSQKNKKSSADKILTNAIEYMMSNYHISSLSVKDIAADMFISEIYLRKLFEKRYKTTPFKALTDIRMKKAYLLAKEKRPVKEIAEEVGYSAVCQFSRAYKKYYGFSPSKT